MPPDDGPAVVKRTDVTAEWIERVNRYTLGSEWRWQRPRTRGRAAIERLYRATLRAHARRKAFISAYGQTPCLPETAAVEMDTPARRATSWMLADLASLVTSEIPVRKRFRKRFQFSAIDDHCQEVSRERRILTLFLLTCGGHLC